MPAFHFEVGLVELGFKALAAIRRYREGAKVAFHIGNRVQLHLERASAASAIIRIAFPLYVTPLESPSPVFLRATLASAETCKGTLDDLRLELTPAFEYETIDDLAVLQQVYDATEMSRYPNIAQERAVETALKIEWSKRYAAEHLLQKGSTTRITTAYVSERFEPSQWNPGTTLVIRLFAWLSLLSQTSDSPLIEQDEVARIELEVPSQLRHFPPSGATISAFTFQRQLLPLLSPAERGTA